MVVIGPAVCILWNIEIHLHFTLQWRLNERNGVSNHQPHDRLLNRIFMRRSKKKWKLRVTGLFEGTHRWAVNSPHKGPVTWKMFPFDDVIMIQYLYTDTVQIVDFFLRGRQGTDFPQSQCFGCWWPADAWDQGISNHGIDEVIQEYHKCVSCIMMINQSTKSAKLHQSVAIMCTKV